MTWEQEHVLGRRIPGVHWLGLDLGSQRDASAIVVVEPVTHIPEHPTPEQLVRAARTGTTRQLHFHLRHITRSTPGTSYVDTIDQLAEVCRVWRPDRHHFDETGVGVGIGHMLAQAHREGRIGGAYPLGVTITGGQESSGLHITKADLVSLVMRPIEEGRLHVDPDLPGAPKLAQELRDYRVTAGRTTDSYGAATESAHDDLVIALALALVPSTRFRFGGEPEGATELHIPAEVPA